MKHSVKVDADLLTRTAQRVLEIEGSAVSAMAAALPGDFVPAIEVISTAEGRVIVSGMGKSGHVGRKIAATLASTGTPSFFVHPAEASHGDLGMVRPEDVVIAISNSGQTTELGDLISHTRRFSIPLIGISKRLDSTLMEASDFKLLLPDAPEACVIGMAPTTSTTLTIALGDALAVTLMEQRGFLPENFRVFHPGGKLGAQLATIAQLMHPVDETPIVDAATPMPETLIEMSDKGFGIACVVQDGVLEGVISDGDLRRNMSNLMSLTAIEAATKNPKTMTTTMLAAEAVALMNANKVNALIVVDERNAPIGILNIHDCLRAGVV